MTTDNDTALNTHSLAPGVLGSEGGEVRGGGRRGGPVSRYAEKHGFKPESGRRCPLVLPRRAGV